MDRILQDLRHGFRRLARSPVFAGLIVLSLGLGIGANVALFRLLHAAVPKSLPVASVERLIGAAMGERGGFHAAAGDRPAREWRASSAGGRMGCLRIAAVGIHTTVSFRMARRSGEIGVRVAVGDAGRQPCA